jgi:hypothetical protein
MEISKEEKLRILNLHESYKEYHGTIINEQGYQPDNGGGRGGTSASSAGQYISGGAWDQKGPFFKTQRKTPETEVKEVDITGGNQEYQGYTKGLSIDQIPTDNQSPGNNIESMGDAGPQYSIANAQDDGYDGTQYDDDNPPYDRQRPDPKKGKSEKEWRSPPCCRPCGGGKWKRDCGELERAPGSKKSNSTGCIYNSYSDCQLAGKSVNEHTIGNGSGFVDNQGRSASLDKFTRRQQEMSEGGFDPEYGIVGTEGGHQSDPDRYKKMTAKELTVAILEALRKKNDPVQSIIEAVIEKQFQIREGERRRKKEKE